MPGDVEGRKGVYYHIDGVDMPSVTSILKVVNKPALSAWLQRRAIEKALSMGYASFPDPPSAGQVMDELRSEGDATMGRGTDAHRLAQWYAEHKDGILDWNGENLRPDPGNPYWPAIVSFFQTMRPIVLASELIVYNPEHKYAGTLDLLCRIGDSTYVVDYKTSKAVYPEHALQVEAYRRCERAVYDPSRTVLEHQVRDGPMADKGAVVLLRDDGTFGWNEVSGDFEAFLAFKRGWEWKQSQR